MSVCLGGFRKSASKVAIAVALLFCAMSASATGVTFEALSLGSDRWRYFYSISNTSLPSPIRQFSIYFDLNWARELTVSGSAAGWDSIVIQPDLALQSRGFFDSASFLDGVLAGSSASGFAVDFTWLGSQPPGTQSYEIYGADFELLGVGMTAPVPEPSKVILMLLGLGTLLLLRSGRLSPLRLTAGARP